MINAPKLDRIDINILAELQRSGRITNAQLADKVGLSPSPCLSRVKRLETAGYISGYSAIINLSKVGGSQIVFTSVTLGDHRRADFAKFEQKIAQFEELVECHLVSGGFDYMLKFVVRGIAEYQEMMEEILESNIGVSKYFSYIVIKSAVVRGQPPVKLHVPSMR
ncbi:DNA-binding Lrp family transcriptional regulator [Sphingobium sp. B2D3A]|uniref:Lrp/AsnC family transcriptional regulator n=1 Tax=unclassified Sphingobium TaxID=2611147 RepID=UPI00222425D5|nr:MULTISPECIES: winged helix-turn-helix transcriptional regulator [unclassified Sphingobium]MCW2338867.1 DNA-binding Lrp family transcriptional regulator [Sphingobium sp. B2D3A]MCW2385292.1 DNA-binding Lrp family transcriptional regulator [Sphingobium sp. B2D3D]MCW2387323.1 DNA-binding Lrp family transcriptional regulator [Sphingobium sp. B11D3B]MCW2394042.1 DNA-binding Lrp family transcriptional regulator [Sphingobium sp. B8D3B]MCW2413352.1 DNA-binding Lrp family transcriptional regulator [S